uniref:Uncharacterized protein n=1 Tax=Meloidogyne javanica TaxID=6303 RepID=A0A915MEP4_MELJA
MVLSNLPEYIDEQCNVDLARKFNSNWSLGEGEHALCILSRLFIFATTLEEKLYEYKIKEISKVKGHHEGQSDRKSIINDFIEKARGVWLQEASINILENLGPNNEVTMLKNRKMKEKYLGKGLFSTETAKQKAELLGAEFISLFDIQFGDIDVKRNDKQKQQHFQPYEIKDVSPIKQEYNLAKEIQFSPALSDKTQSSSANITYDNLPVLTLEEASNIIKTIYEFDNYTNFEALIKSDFIVGYYEKWHERELKNKFKDEINFKKLELDEQNILRELSEKEHALCILSRLFIFAYSLEEKLSKFKSKEEKSSTSGHHEGQSDRKIILNDFIEKARGVWLQEASINILENLGPNNEITMLKNRKMKEKYLSKGLFSTETAKQKAELLGAEFISLFDIQFGDIDVKMENQIDLNDFDFDFSDTSNIDFNLLQDLIN